MKDIEVLRFPHQHVIGVSPKNSSLAIVSASKSGGPGPLNSFVLKECGYSLDDFPERELDEANYFLLQKGSLTPILFIITVGRGATIDSLKDNLYNGLIEYSLVIDKTTVWIPLMGTGAGRLSFLESYRITVGVLNSLFSVFNKQTSFLISIPEGKEGQEFLEMLKIENIILDGTNSKIDEILKKFKGKFYLGGSIWDNENQLDDFYEKNVWQTGYEEKHAAEINSIKRGDVIFIKSTFASQGNSMLRIKAAGQVTGNPGDGRTVEVDWKIKDIRIDITDLGYYRTTLAQVEGNDLKIILNALGEQLTNSDLLKVSVWGRSTDNVKIDNDSAFSPNDLLEINNEIEVFARLLAQKDLHPPFAIALFGDWGSGKSFFINHLQLKIKQLSGSKIVRKNSEELYYCKNIIHIPFNSWAYMDANLWIGFMACIFEKIDEYITGLSKAKKLRKDLKSQLSNEFEFVKGQKIAMELEKNGLEEKKEKLEKAIEVEKEKLDIEIKKLKNESWSERLNLIWAKLDISEKSKLELKEFGISPEMLEKTAYEEIPRKIKSFKNYTKQFFSLSVPQLIGWAILIGGMLVAIFVSHTKWFNDVIHKSVTIISTILMGVAGMTIKIGVALRYFKPYIDQALKVQLDFNQKVKEAEREHQDKITRFHIEKETTSIEIEKLQAKLDKVNSELNDIDYTLHHALDAKLLTEFIRRRTSSTDYNDKLGIVSIIRKDLETLSELFIDQKINPLLPQQELEILKEKKEKLAKIKDEFSGEPIERIILYIDDLDRCADNKVLEVLQAVHLLMAFPLFTVVVGVDKRCVTNALFQNQDSKYFKLHDTNYSKIEPIEPDEYLEKIFQIPFQIKEPSNEAVNIMIEALLERDLETSDEDLNGGGEEEIIEPDKRVNIEPIMTKSDVIPQSAKLNIGPEDLKINKFELEFIKGLSHLIGTSPRTVKRFINLYRLIKAHEGLTEDKPDKEIICTLFVLAINVGEFKSYSQDLFDRLVFKQDAKLKEIFNFYRASGSAVFYNALNTQTKVMLEIYNYTGEDLLLHLDFVKRFSFNTFKKPELLTLSIS